MVLGFVAPLQPHPFAPAEPYTRICMFELLKRLLRFRTEAKMAGPLPPLISVIGATGTGKSQVT